MEDGLSLDKKTPEKKKTPTTINGCLEYKCNVVNCNVAIKRVLQDFKSYFEPVNTGPVPFISFVTDVNKCIKDHSATKLNFGLPCKGEFHWVRLIYLFKCCKIII